MFFPYGSTAILYHLPIATVSIILLNILIFFSSGAWDESTQRMLVLQYGAFNPIQWITSNFMHADFIHLIGNMLCLWGFGFVVEGKIGWPRFLLVYLGIGLVQCFIEQTMMLPFGGGASLGSSSVIFGLMAIGMIWAPECEMQCVFILGLFRPIFFSASMYTVATTALLLQIGMGLFSGFAMSSQVLHLMGAGVGAAVGIVMVKKNWVDCDGADLFRVWSGEFYKEQEQEQNAANELLEQAHAKRMEQFRQEQLVVEAPAPLTTEELGSITLESQELVEIRRRLANDDPRAAWEAYRRLLDDLLEIPPEKELLQIITLLQQQKAWAEAEPAMRAYLEQGFAKKAAEVRLRLAQVYLQVSKRPQEALEVLDALEPEGLSQAHREKWETLRKLAERQLG